MGGWKLNSASHTYSSSIPTDAIGHNIKEKKKSCDGLLTGLSSCDGQPPTTAYQPAVSPKIPLSPFSFPHTKLHLLFFLFIIFILHLHSKVSPLFSSLPSDHLPILLPFPTLLPLLQAGEGRCVAEGSSSEPNSLHRSLQSSLSPPRPTQPSPSQPSPAQPSLTLPLELKEME
ncbi:hypothetical protein E2C01_043448 [Portunus trituberculatus]|uniref:Uncharacterized protein n=1 Tax=Portunus trituberculatus TaxID=210409 RepID=A0A5B7FWR6_PORTR|nr:hypothetical protein [Portunus trituberculatus]